MSTRGGWWGGYVGFTRQVVVSERFLGKGALAQHVPASFQQVFADAGWSTVLIMQRTRGDQRHVILGADCAPPELVWNVEGHEIVLVEQTRDDKDKGRGVRLLTLPLGDTSSADATRRQGNGSGGGMEEEDDCEMLPARAKQSASGAAGGPVAKLSRRMAVLPALPPVARSCPATGTAELAVPDAVQAMLAQAVQQAIMEQGTHLDAKIAASREEAKRNLADLEDRMHGFATKTDERITRLTASAASAESRMGELVAAQDTARAQRHAQFEAYNPAPAPYSGVSDHLPPWQPGTRLTRVLS